MNPHELVISVRETLADRLKVGAEDWIDVKATSNGTLTIIAVSEQFADLSPADRRKRVESLLPSGTRVGLVSLYSPSEAKSEELTEPQSGPIVANTWLDATLAVINRADDAPPMETGNLIRTVAFYGFKGGVGRTTTLLYTAWLLAKRGRKVVVVDMDLESPGIANILPHLNRTAHPGMVDYLYDRAIAPKGTGGKRHIGEVLQEVPVPDAPGRFYVVNAGSMSLQYISKLDNLRGAPFRRAHLDLWRQFSEELYAQVQPDLILLDTRTGFDEWGAFSLLRAADEVVAVLFPSAQNMAGIRLVMECIRPLKQRIFPIFSMVPDTDESRERARGMWKSLRDQDSLDDAVMIPYHLSIAAADKFPLDSAINLYEPIANLVDAEMQRNQRRQVLQDQDRQKILESLRFKDGAPVAETKDDHLADWFCKAAYVERFFDESVRLIRGRKGTGKTMLYRAAVKYGAQLVEMTKGKIARTVMLAGHGKFVRSLSHTQLVALDRAIGRVESGTWAGVWRAYALLRLWRSEATKALVLATLPEPLAARLDEKGEQEPWSSGEVQFIAQLASEPAWVRLVENALQHLSASLQQADQRIWLLVDNLEEDFPEADAACQMRALQGLFHFIQQLDQAEFRALRVKVFLRETSWSRLPLTNKDYFNGRDLSLTWTLTDFLRLALKQSMASRRFAALVQKFAPLQEIDAATQAELSLALQLLWGGLSAQGMEAKPMGHWLYDQLIDANGTCFPQSVVSMLQHARDHELRRREQEKTDQPDDRLISLEAMKVGLRRAATERIAELREECQALAERGLFEQLKKLQATGVTEKKLSKVWKWVDKAGGMTFPDFIAWLQDIGLMQLEQTDGEQRTYRFAPLYVTGFEAPELAIPSITPISSTDPMPSSIHNGPRQNRWFMGRQEILSELETQRHSDGRGVLTRVLTGMGGIGKTQIALAYCYEQVDSYQHIWWLHAAEPATLATEYAALAEEMELSEAADAGHQEQIVAVRHWLEQHGDWLLVFDDAEDERSLAEFLPRSGTGHVLITSRNPDWRHIGKPLSVPLWPRHTSIAYIKEYVPEATDVAADQLAELMGDLPLGLAQAVAYVVETAVSLETYCDLFSRYQEQMLAKGSLPDGYEATVATAWENSLQRLAERSPRALQLLTLVAFLAPDSIPEAVLQTFLGEVEPILGEVIELRVPEALSALTRYALIRRDGLTISVHRLVQAAVRGRLSSPERAIWAAKALQLMLKFFPRDAQDVTTWRHRAALVPHALAAAQQGEAPELAVALLDRVGGYLLRTGKYVLARAVLERALAASRAAATSPIMEAAILGHLADAHKSGGDFGMDYEYAQAALSVLERHCAPDDWQIARARTDLASSAVRLGRWDEAREQAETLKERLLRLTPGEEELAHVALNNLAWVYHAMGEPSSALELYSRSQQIQERQYGETYLGTITICSRIGEVLRELGRFAEARAYLERALTLAESILPDDHPSLAEAHHTLAHLLSDIGDQTAARAHFEQAVAIRRRVLRTGHPDLADSLANLGALLSHIGDFPGARAHLEEALAIEERTYGAAHPEVATTLQYLGALYLAQGDSTAARRHLERALAIFRAFYEESSPRVQRSLGLLQKCR